MTGPPKREQQPHMFMVQNSTNSRPGVNQAALAGSPELPVPSEGLAIDLLLSLSQLRVQPCSWPPAQRGSADNHPRLDHGLPWAAYWGNSKQCRVSQAGQALSFTRQRSTPAAQAARLPWQPAAIDAVTSRLKTQSHRSYKTLTRQASRLCWCWCNEALGSLEAAALVRDSVWSLRLEAHVAAGWRWSTGGRRCWRVGRCQRRGAASWGRVHSLRTPLSEAFFLRAP